MSIQVAPWYNLSIHFATNCTQFARQEWIVGLALYMDRVSPVLASLQVAASTDDRLGLSPLVSEQIWLATELTSPNGFNRFRMGFTTPLPWTERHQGNTSSCLMAKVAIDVSNADDAVELA